MAQHKSLNNTELASHASGQADQQTDIDVASIESWLRTPADTTSVAGFVPGPADGSVYFTDTRGYHTALNGGDEHRVHLVAALAFQQVTE